MCVYLVAEEKLLSGLVFLRIYHFKSCDMSGCHVICQDDNLNNRRQPEKLMQQADLSLAAWIRVGYQTSTTLPRADSGSSLCYCGRTER